MCNKTVPTVTLQTAVLMQVQEFANQNQAFSVHDITRNVRTKTFKGELDIPEVKVIGASTRFDIPHTQVKSIFDDLWNTGVFDPMLTLSRNFNGTYFVYTPTLVAQPSTTQTTSPATTTPVGPTPVTYTGTLTPTKLSRQDVVARVQIYLDHCASKNFRPTIKQVQSAIKREVSTGWTCEELQDLIEVDLDTEVVEDPSYVSMSQVVV